MIRCPCCGQTNARPKDDAASDTMFYPVGGEDKNLVFCVACMNVVSGPPGEDGCLFRPSDERLAADLAAIQRTAKLIADTAREIQEKETKHAMGCRGEGYRVRKDGAIEFCFSKHRSDEWLLKTVQITLNELGFPDAHHEGGASRLRRKKCPNKQGYAHALVGIHAIELQDE